ncbi:MAG TPA: hypothetical protein VIK92_07520 [Thermaerobacter sp.]
MAVVRVRFSPAAAAFVRRELAKRPELQHCLTVTAFLVSGCCSPNLPPEVHLGPPPEGGFRAVTVALEATPAAAGPEPASPEPASVEVYVDPLVDEFVREWYGDEARERAERAELRVDLARYGEREELTVHPWPPRAEGL